MKRSLFTPLAVALALAALPLSVLAQAVPLQISYQGRVTDAAGVAVANNTVTNRTVIFRIWSHATDTAAASRLYTEQQNVTIANGEFSVLIGSGTAVAGEAKPGLDTLFSGTAVLPRFIGITVDDGTASADPEISPRQQIVSDVYAFRAKIADTVLSGGITTAQIANNAVTSILIADSAVGSTKIADLSIVSNDIADSAVTSAKIVDGTIATVDIAAGAVTAAKLGSDVGIFSTSGGNVYRTSGNLGVGTTVPTALLSTGGTLGNTKIAVYDDGGSARMGLGVQGSQFRLHLNQASDRFSFLNAAAGSEVFTVLGNGNVGVGVPSPSAALHVHTGTGDSRILLTNNLTGSAAPDGLAVGTQADGAFVWNHEGTALRFGTSSAERVRIEADGRMGFNATNGDGNSAYIMRSPASYYILNILDRNGAWAFSFTEDGTAWKKANTSWSQLSDRRLKQNISSLSGSLDRLLKLEAVTFDFKDEANGKGRQTGFIAQDVEKVFPEWVKPGPGGFLGVGFAGFEAVTVQAFRELRTEKDAQIAKLEARVKELEARNTSAAQRLDALEQRFNAFAKPLVGTQSGR